MCYVWKFWDKILLRRGGGGGGEGGEGGEFKTQEKLNFSK